MTYLPTPLPEKATINGVEVEIATLGEGKKILYLHGGDGANLSAPYIKMLAERFQVVMASHPGFGESELPAHYTSIDDLAIFYLDLIEQLELTDCILMGSSFGGWLAAEIAVLCGEAISRLILVDPLGIKISGRETRDILDLFSIDIKDLPDYLFYNKPEAVNYQDVPDDIVRRVVRNRETLALVSWAPTLYNPKLKFRLNRIKVPTLVLWGDEDKVVNTDYGTEFTSKIANAVFEVIPRAGHYAAYDQPEELLGRVTHFLADGGK